MAHDPGLVDLMRTDLQDAGLEETGAIREMRMFGGLTFLLNGNMLCGVHKGGAMYRVGKDNAAAALALDGVRTMDMTGRPMPGFVDVADEAMAEDATRAALLGLALEFVGALAPK